MEIICENLSKHFVDRPVFRNISFRISSGQAMGITGPNGSGKTTLMRIICYLLQPSQGTVSYRLNSQPLERENIYTHIGFVGPYLELYEDLTARENLQFFARMKDLTDSDERIDALLEKFRLQGREDDLVRAYSSGMKQRLKYVFALLNKPSVLMVDEPRSNLDEEGIKTVYDILSQQKKDNILIVATNEREDLTYTDWTLPINA